MDSILDQFNQSLGNLGTKLQGWLNSLIVNLPDLLLAILVLVVGIYLTKRMQNYFYRLISRFSDKETVNRLLSNIATALFFLIVLFIVLSILGLDTALTTLLGTAGVAGLAVGLALQDPIVNLFAGIMMSMRTFFKIGDLVETNDFFGVVEKISLRSTILKTLQGQEVVLPNKNVYQNPLKNYSTSGERRIDLSCGVSYGDNLENVKQIAISAIEDNLDYNNNRPVELFFTEFGNSSINFTLRFWTNSGNQKNYMELQSNAIIAIKKAFDANDITIPFPIRTLDFGIKGGEKLNEVISAGWLEKGNGNGTD
ncbi:mechanosensitive ion channel family protein [Flavilitoribacter nigricans]|uniref:Mechanosensitive ion channel protein MscS n=1 Tax=Flavilitoribacter nigricans (strain ATCC 23147 / DSM 23189 / NBRC 102662 / NCIMB 1420 / SS-2) TaxID=1122177 RepID=A0A2D0N029_FLAN2|nr:mechanosensitive ion channel family protein [Flavilitoribacter nigricans]PHN01902.1 mechanosensitive ion channel protein MscS [Flavilitoribacter nigricans DSM 23189 = NBRC 102662]